MTSPTQTQVSESRQASRRTALELLTVAGFCAFLFYFGLGAFGLVGADEPRYAQIAREMLERRDVITPTLYGKPWLEKPPLYYWRAMEGFAVAGVHDWTARLPSAAAATLLVFIVFFFMRAFRRGSELNAALMTAACVGTVGFARAAGPDMLLAAAFAVGMLFWWTSLEVSGGVGSENLVARSVKPEARRRWNSPKLWLALFYLFMAFGMLAKGPVAPFLAAVIIILFAAVRRDWGLVRRTLWWPGVLLFLVVSLPWYIAVQVRNPQFFREFILQHNLERFATNRYHHKQPFWYYLPVTLAGALPWTAFFVAGFGRALRAWKERSDQRFAVFLALWVVVVVVFFTFSTSKLPGYILPAIPACTLLAADYVRQTADRRSWSLVLLQGLLSAVVLAAALLFPTIAASRHHAAGVSNNVLVIVAVVGIAVLIGTAFTLGWRGMSMLRLVVLAPLVVAVAFVIKIGGPVIDATQSQRPVAASISEIESGHATVAVFQASREVEYGLAFYRNHGIPRYERDGIPEGNHMVVVPARYTEELARVVSPKRASRVGGYPAQRLEFYWISPPMAHVPMGSAPAKTP